MRPVAQNSTISRVRTERRVSQDNGRLSQENGRLSQDFGRCRQDNGRGSPLGSGRSGCSFGGGVAAGAAAGGTVCDQRGSGSEGGGSPTRGRYGSARGAASVLRSSCLSKPGTHEEDINCADAAGGTYPSCGVCAKVAAGMPGTSSSAEERGVQGASETRAETTGSGDVELGDVAARGEGGVGSGGGGAGDCAGVRDGDVATAGGGVTASERGSAAAISSDVNVEVDIAA
eukprot:1152493-Pleurochrysis_carterae.AAC.1